MKIIERDIVAGFVAEVFADKEPLALHFGMTKSEMIQFCEPLLEAGRDQFSMVAIDEHRDRTVGALIGESFSCPEPAWEPDLVNRMEPILAFLQDLDDQFFAEGSISPNEVFTNSFSRPPKIIAAAESLPAWFGEVMIWPGAKASSIALPRLRVPFRGAYLWRKWVIGNRWP